jgi:hypothetical protein
MNVLRLLEESIKQTDMTMFFRLIRSNKLVTFKYTGTMNSLFDPVIEHDTKIYKNLRFHSTSFIDNRINALTRTHKDIYIYIPEFNVIKNIVPELSYMNCEKLSELKNSANTIISNTPKYFNRYWFVAMCSIISYSVHYSTPVYMISRPYCCNSNNIYNVVCSSHVINDIFQKFNKEHHLMLFYIISILTGSLIVGYNSWLTTKYDYTHMYDLNSRSIKQHAHYLFERVFAYYKDVGPLCSFNRICKMYDMAELHFKSVFTDTMFLNLIRTRNLSINPLIF